MADVPLGNEEFLVQTKDGRLRFMKVNVYGVGAIRLNSDRLGAFTNISKQQANFRIDVVYDWPLDSYECELVQEIRNWESVRKFLSPVLAERGLEEVDIIFDLLFFWRSLAGAAVSRVATSSGILLWNIAEQNFGGLLGSVVDANIEAAFEPLLKTLFKVANIRSRWALDVATGVATKLTSDKAMEIISPANSSPSVRGFWWPPAPEAVDKLSAVLAFRRLIGAGSLHAFQFKWCPGTR